MKQCSKDTDQVSRSYEGDGLPLSSNSTPESVTRQSGAWRGTAGEWKSLVETDNSCSRRRVACCIQRPKAEWKWMSLTVTLLVLRGPSPASCKSPMRVQIQSNIKALQMLIGWGNMRTGILARSLEQGTTRTHGDFMVSIQYTLSQAGRGF